MFTLRIGDAPVGLVLDCGTAYLMSYRSVHNLISTYTGAVGYLRSLSPPHPNGCSTAESGEFTDSLPRLGLTGCTFPKRLVVNASLIVLTDR